MMIAVSKDISADRFQDSRTSPYERLLLGRPRRLAVKGASRPLSANHAFRNIVPPTRFPVSTITIPAVKQPGRVITLVTYRSRLLKNRQPPTRATRSATEGCV